MSRSDCYGTVTGGPVGPVLKKFTGVVTITGTVTIGQVLTANITDLGGTGGVLSYQWRRDGGSIGGATNPTYILQDADAGAAITVTVVRSGYYGSITSDPVIPLVVSITGIVRVGQTLTANVATQS